MRMWRQSPEGLYFTQVIYLINVVEMVLHALYRHTVACLDTLRL